MSRINRMNPFLRFIVPVLASTLAGCAGEPRRATASLETVNDVSIVLVQKVNVPDSSEAVGTLRAVQTSQLASQMMRNLVEVRAHEGDRVERGQILAVIDDAQPRAGLDQALAAENAAEKEVSAAESNYALAEATLKRYQQLYDKKSVSPQEFDEIKARYQSAEARREMARAGNAEAIARVAQARKSFEYTRIRAPFAGVITEKKADAGTLATPGMPIFTLENTRNFRLEAAVNESDIGHVRAGQAVPVTIDALANEELSGKVAEIVPAADPASRSFLVKIELAARTGLRSGLFGRASFPRGERMALLIPRTAVVERGQLQGVYVVDSSQVAGLRYIALGKTMGQQVEALSGLQEGEKLIAAPGDRELGGKRIMVRQ
jgi:RND family efflux transporter MFP subunit